MTAKSLTFLLFDWTAPNNSEFEETNWLKIPMKEIYSATDNFNASTFIGQGVAGENPLSLGIELSLLVLKNAHTEIRINMA